MENEWLEVLVNPRLVFSVLALNSWTNFVKFLERFFSAVNRGSVESQEFLKDKWPFNRHLEKIGTEEMISTGFSISNQTFAFAQQICQKDIKMRFIKPERLRNCLGDPDYKTDLYNDLLIIFFKVMITAYWPRIGVPWIKIDYNWVSLSVSTKVKTNQL